MIWDSIAFMTAFDAVIASLTVASLLVIARHRKLLVTSSLALSSAIIVLGLLLIGIFYLGDLFALWVLPLFVGPQITRTATEHLRFNYHWLTILIAMICMFTGFFLMLRKLLQQGTELRTVNENLGRVSEATQQAEDTLHESEANYKAILKAQPDLMFQLNEEGVHLDYYASSVNELYCDPEAFLGKRVDEVLPPDVGEKYMHSIQETLKTSQMQEFDYQLAFPEGSRHYTCRLVLSGKNKALAIVTDISKRKQVEEELLAHQRELRSLASALASTEEKTRRDIATVLHDTIAQNLVSCKLILDMETSAGLPGSLREKLASVSKTLGQVATKTQDLTIELASPTLYTLGLLPAIREWLHEEVERKHGVDCQSESEGNAGHLSDESKAFIFRAVKEASYNAVKYAQPKTLTVKLAARQHDLEVIVSDDGIGFQEERRHARSATGTGLGLFSIREHVEHLGGTFDIESLPGKGTNLKFTLPKS